MSIQRQQTGRQERWTLENVKDGFEKFYTEHNRYPTAEEFDTFPFLPSSRTIQRKFGGLVQLRKQLKLKGQHDFREGDHSSNRAKEINKRAHRVEQEVYEYLTKRFGVEFVHREYFFADDKRKRTDFFIYYKKGNFSVDVFYPKNRHNFIGCLNNKMKSYATELMLQYPVVFLQMNDFITQDEIDDVLANKKNKLPKGQSAMNFNRFKEFCGTKEPR